MTDAAQQLLPAPQRLRLLDIELAVPSLGFADDGPPLALTRPAVDFLTDRIDIAPPGSGSLAPTARPVRFAVLDDLPPEGYELSVGPGAAFEIRAGDRHGFFYGSVTLAQWLGLHHREGEPRSVPGVEIRDWPDFRRRGLLLDISRNKVPSMRSLLRLVDLCAELKFNQLQLYMEHTFAYQGHEDVWRGAGALTADECQQLDGYCRTRSIELVPNQNSFGHFHRWLTHEPYRALAECPEGVQHPFSDAVEPFSLCPIDSNSVELLRDLYSQLLPNFTSGRFHVGFDETFEIGRGHSRQACEEQGLAGVYFSFLESVRKLAAEHNRGIQIWADMLLEHRELLTRMPKDITLCAWGYEAGHPFREDCASLAATGCPVYACPGTGSWSSFAGRTNNTLANLAEAAAGGQATGAEGYLVTDWGDRGHLQPFSSSYLGLAAAAGFAWHRSSAKRRTLADWGRAIDRWILSAPESGLGAAAIALGNSYTQTGATQKNGTALFHLLMSPSDGLEHGRYRGLDVGGLDRTLDSLAAIATDLGAAETASSEAARTRDELAWVTAALSLGCEVGKARLGAPFSELPDLRASTRERLKADLDELVDECRKLWLQRNRVGGLEDSLDKLGRLRRQLGT